MVLVSHWLFFFPVIRVLNLSEMGVDLFFAISGFLITLQLLNFKEKASQNSLSKGSVFKEFYIRRIFRIFPLYYLIVIASTFFNSGEIREALIYNLTFTTNFYIINTDHWPAIFSHFWSLSVEEHFYLFWPFIVIFFSNKLLPYVTLVLIAVTFIIKLFVVGGSGGYYFLHVHTISCIDLIMYGCLLAWLYKNKNDSLKKILQWRGLIFFIISLIVVINVFKYYSFEGPTEYVLLRSLSGVLFAFLIGTLVYTNASSKPGFLENKWLVLGGKLSFGIYLVHNFVPGLLLGIKDLSLHWTIEFAVYFLVTLGISALLHWVIELPLKRFGKLTFANTLLKD